jgi:glycerol-3-phosphate dehydrogenase (NAD(P)+)
MTASINHFGVVGGGAWGTALALLFNRADRRVTLWMRSRDLADQLQKDRENRTYLPNIKIDARIRITADITDLSSCDVLVLAVPAQQTRSVCKVLLPYLGNGKALITTGKGIELVTHKLMSEVISEELPGYPVYVLSGPSFAVEIGRGLPSALTLAGADGVQAMAHAISSPSCRIYTTDDTIGAQIGGATKNVLAIACGIVVGRGLGENARAALMTRGLTEIIRLGNALGARPQTLMGLSGFGDVVSCCTSTLSRNMSLGIALGQGRDLSDALKSAAGVTEGVATATAVLGLAEMFNVDMPIVSAVETVLHGRASIDDISSSLLSRPLRHETETIFENLMQSLPAIA